MIIRIGLWGIMLFGGIIGGYYIDNLFFVDIHNNLLFHIISFLVGAVILFFVMKISKNTGRTLANFGRTGEVKRMETNVLVKEGIYKYMRHPMHLGLLFFPLAIAFIVASPSFILIISPIEILFMLIMIKLAEEPEAVRKFGDEYLKYKNQTPMFCFNINCLKELLKNVSKLK